MGNVLKDMVAMVTLALLAATKFNGGSPSVLAGTIAAATGKSVVIVQGAQHDLKPFSFDSADLDTFARQVKENSPFRLSPGPDMAFSDERYVATHFQKLLPEPAPGPGLSNKMPDHYLTSGKVTLKTGNKPIALKAIAAAAWSRPVKVDLLLQDLGVSVDAEAMPEMKFLKLVAHAAGADLLDDNGGWRIGYDPDQLRIRLISTFKDARRETTPNSLDAKRNFYVACINAMTNSQLVDIFARPGAGPKMDIEPNSSLALAAVQYLRDLQTLEQSMPRRGGRQLNNIFNRIDNRAKVHLLMGSDGEIVLSVPILNPRNRTSSYMDF